MSGKLTHFHSLLPYCTEPGDREGGGDGVTIRKSQSQRYT